MKVSVLLGNTMISIQKSYLFCFGHRVWNQQLSGNQLCKCVWNHGHQGKLDLSLTSELMTCGMVVDFNEIKSVKRYIDDNIDHHFLMDVEDPLLGSWLHHYGMSLDDLYSTECGFKVSMDKLYIKHEREFFQSLVIFPFVPTSENLALFMFAQVNRMLKDLNAGLNLNVRLESLRWWESDTSFAEVRG